MTEKEAFMKDKANKKLLDAVKEVFEKDIIKKLDKALASGADIDAVNDNGISALGSLSAKGRKEAIHFLLDNGANPNAISRISSDGTIKKTAISEIAGSSIIKGADKEALLIKFIEKGANLAKEGIVLWFVDWPNVFKKCIEYGGDINNTDGGGRTALMQAAINGDIDLVEYILELKPELEATDKDGRTALAWAVCGDNVDVANCLLTAGANPNAKDSSGDTPRSAAMDDLSSDEIRALFEKL